jgi:rare lipoprotein A (peptidoglycan hydrolase)
MLIPNKFMSVFSFFFINLYLGQIVPTKIAVVNRPETNLIATSKINDQICSNKQQNPDDFSQNTQSETIFSVEIYPREKAKPKFPQNLVLLLKSVLLWKKPPNPEKMTVSVVKYTRDTTAIITTSLRLSLDFSKGKEFYFNTEKYWFQVKLNGQVISQVFEEKTAKDLATNLVNSIQAADFYPVNIKLGYEQEKPTLKIGNQLLLSVDDNLANLLREQKDILAIKWANNLRNAFNLPSWSLIEAQKQLYHLAETDQKLKGFASWYGGFFHGRKTANGEIYNQYDLTVAHKSLPFNTYLQITNLKSGNTVIVRVNDRGPYIYPRSLDLSLTAARCLESEKLGVIPYQAIILQRAEAK